jgi:hypothetical protein
MLTQAEALKILNLSPEASAEAIETAYQRLVRRYPPEFHPDRFRQIDQSYRILTSTAFLVESILTARKTEPETDLAQRLADLPLVAEEDAVAKSLEEIRTLLLVESLWPGSWNCSWKKSGG